MGKEILMKQTALILRRCGVLLLAMLLVPASGWGMVASIAPGGEVYQAENDGFQLVLGLSTSFESGDMTYEIHGEQDGGWKSELKWPLDSMLYIGGVSSLRFGERIQLNAGFWKSVTDDAGTLEDSDWLYGYYGNARTIYSETEATLLDGAHFDMSARYDFWKQERILIGAIVGYKATKWEWEAGNGRQWTIDPSEFYEGALPGIGIAYEEQLDVPYVGAAISSAALSGQLGVNAYLLFSPFAKCEDEDDHLLRGKLSQGDTDGTFWAIGGDVRWNFAQRFVLSAFANHSAYDLEGEQSQYYYEGESEGSGSTGIDMTMEGSQTYLGATIGLTF